jgi:KaiC/GvpD/RAD55 family RecA-like ATPase
MLEVGIKGWDDLVGGLPENTSTLVYGPPKSGKSIFCYQFALNGLMLDEPCLYVATDYDLRLLRQILSCFNWSVDEYLKEDKMYLVDAISSLAGAKVNPTENYKTTSVQDPTDLMVKIGLGARFLYPKTKNFRAVLDSLTTLFAFNPDMMVLRLLSAYIRRIKEAGGTSVTCYTEGIAIEQIENQLKATMDNIIRFDGDKIYIEAIMGGEKISVPYNITSEGIVIV